MAEKKTVAPLRLKGPELEMLLEELDRANPGEGGSSKREMRRWAMHGVRAVLTIADNFGSQKHSMILPRNLSTTGIGCINGAFIHLGTRCFVSMRDRHGKSRSIVGTVMRCKHLRGSLHDVGIKFDGEIQPEDFREFNDEHVFHRENVQLDQLHGVILVVEESVLDQKLIAAFFKNSSLELSYARDAKTGLDMLSETPDMVIVDYKLPDMKGTELIAKMCEAGYAKPILMLTSDGSAALREAALQAGASEVLTKPVSAELMHQAAAEYLIGGSGRGSIRAVRDPAIVSDDMVDEYVQELHKLAHELGTHIKEDALDQFRTKADQIRGSASGYGFEGISELADGAIRELDSTMSISESISHLRELISACQRTVPSIAEARDDENSEDTSS